MLRANWSVSAAFCDLSWFCAVLCWGLVCYGFKRPKVSVLRVRESGVLFHGLQRISVFTFVGSVTCVPGGARGSLKVQVGDCREGRILAVYYSAHRKVLLSVKRCHVCSPYSTEVLCR